VPPLPRGLPAESSGCCSIGLHYCPRLRKHGFGLNKLRNLMFSLYRTSLWRSKHSNLPARV